MGPETLFLVATFAAPVALGLAALAFFRTAGAGGSRPGWPRMLAGNALVLGLLLSLAFLGLEIRYRWLYDQTDVWNRTRVSQRWFERHWRENANGVRDDVDYPLERSGDRPRITFLGDSYTAAHGVADVADRFANRIRRARPDWEVHALAWNGVNTMEEVDQLRRLVRRGYELDVLVLVFCHNDIDSFIPEFQQLYRRIDVPPDALSFVLAHSYAADFYYQRWRLSQVVWADDVSYAELRRQAYRGRPFRELAHSLGLLQEEARAAGARFGVVTFPWLQMLLAGERVDAIHAAVDAFWAERGVPHLDLLPLFAGLPPDTLVVNHRDTHPSARAHAIAAEAIERFVATRLLAAP